MIMYMCGTDYQIEIDHTNVTLYPTVEQLKRDRKCVDECGIVAVNVEFGEWVVPSIPFSQRRGSKGTEKDNT